MTAMVFIGRKPKGLPEENKVIAVIRDRNVIDVVRKVESRKKAVRIIRV